LVFEGVLAITALINWVLVNSNMILLTNDEIVNASFGIDKNFRFSVGVFIIIWCGELKKTSQDMLCAG